MGEPSGESGREAREIKVTDKRMFTAEGELKEEFRDLGTPGDETAGRESPRPAPAGAAPAGDRLASSGPESGTAGAEVRPPVTPPTGGRSPAGPFEEERGATVETPGSPPGPTPTFLDLISVLAEPVALYLGDARLPDGSSAENLDAARLYIDLLDVVRTKTAGNLTGEESTLLEDVLYQLRMRYVQKRA